MTPFSKTPAQPVKGSPMRSIQFLLKLFRVSRPSALPDLELEKRLRYLVNRARHTDYGKVICPFCEGVSASDSTLKIHLKRNHRQEAASAPADFFDQPVEAGNASRADRKLRAIRHDGPFALRGRLNRYGPFFLELERVFSGRIITMDIAHQLATQTARANGWPIPALRDSRRCLERLVMLRRTATCVA
jgi:hypothetical protein